jgi:molybdopterin-binding protein
MNRIDGSIVHIDRIENYSVTTVSCKHGIDLLSLTLELDDRYREGIRVNLLFKETDVILARDAFVSSIANSVNCMITEIAEGKLFSEVHLSTKLGMIRSIIFTSAIAPLGLIIGGEIYAFIRATDVALMICE